MGDYTSFGFDYESLVLRKLGKMIDAFILTIKPGDDASKLPFSTHAGEELVFVLEGEISFYYADNIYTISKGDCIYYDPAISHKMVSASKEDPAKLLIIIAFLPDISE